MKNLNDIQVKKTVKVEDILSSGNLRERMLALGLTRGAVIDVVRKAAQKII